MNSARGRPKSALARFIRDYRWNYCRECQRQYRARLSRLILTNDWARAQGQGVKAIARSNSC